MSLKRTGYLEWEDYLMATAFLAAKRSKDPCTQAGACIVNNDKKIVGVGYNDMPIGCGGLSGATTPDDESKTKNLYECHAEANAILCKNSADVVNCTMYVGLFPCNECAKIIIQSGIKKVVYMFDKHKDKNTPNAAKAMFHASEVWCRQYKPKKPEIPIKFNQIENGSEPENESLEPEEDGNIIKKKESESEWDENFMATEFLAAMYRFCRDINKKKESESEVGANFMATEFLAAMHTFFTDINKKKESESEWDEYFMATAFLAAQRSKDPDTQVGACIVNNDKTIVGVGYNGMPIGCSDDEFPWGKSENDESLNKHSYVCHAEMNAILYRNSADVRNCTMYVGLFPCNECAKIIIQSGIKKVIYKSDKQRKKHKETNTAAKEMFKKSGVKYRQYIPERTEVTIDFKDIDQDQKATPAPITEINQDQMPQSPPTPVENNQ